MKAVRRLALACMIVAACGGSALAGSVKEAVEAANATFAAAYNKGDAAAVAALYAEDAVVLPPDAARANGRAEIESFWKGTIAAGVSDLELKTLDVTEAGDFAFETGEANLSVPAAGGGKAPASIKYVVVWKKSGDGAWQLLRDIWNANPAAK